MPQGRQQSWGSILTWNLQTNKSQVINESDCITEGTALLAVLAKIIYILEDTKAFKIVNLLKEENSKDQWENIQQTNNCCTKYYGNNCMYKYNFFHNLEIPYFRLTGFEQNTWKI